jgi:hypothetical protein
MGAVTHWRSLSVQPRVWGFSDALRACRVHRSRTRRCARGGRCRRDVLVPAPAGAAAALVAASWSSGTRHGSPPTPCRRHSIRSRRPRRNRRPWPNTAHTFGRWLPCPFPLDLAIRPWWLNSSAAPTRRRLGLDSTLTDGRHRETAHDVGMVPATVAALRGDHATVTNEHSPSEGAVSAKDWG